jgi:16S rRNA processing protein RimM
MERLATGIVRRPHGLDGELRVESFSGETEHFARLRHVTLRAGDRSAEFAVESVSVGGTQVYLKLSGIDSKEAAAGYRGWEVWVPREEASRREADEYYAADLCNCALTLEGAHAARVVGTWENGQATILEVETSEGKRFNVPFMEPYIGTVDIEQGRIELKTPWILQ